VGRGHGGGAGRSARGDAAPGQLGWLAHGAAAYPWLTAAALSLAALYALLAEGTAVATARNAFPAAERAQLALLTAPVAGICAIDLAGIAAITARTGSAGRFAVVCGVTGFVLAPAAGAMTALTAPTQSTAGTGGAVLAAALCGAGPAGALAGLVLLLAGLVAGYLAARAVQLRTLTGANHGARGARRAGDDGRALDADRGGPRRSGCPGAGLHRRAPDRCQTRSGPDPGPGIAPGADPGKVAGGTPVPGAGATLDHG
jgi:hypothetical protein